MLSNKWWDLLSEKIIVINKTKTKQDKTKKTKRKKQVVGSTGYEALFELDFVNVKVHFYTKKVG